VLIEDESDGKIVPTVLDMSECRAYGDTEEVALRTYMNIYLQD
jgi:hypothetical protein